jgi:hypothetical protein
MRWLVTGVDADGRSCVLSETQFPPAADNANPWQQMYIVEPPLSPRPPTRGAFTDLQIPVGGMHWLAFRFTPNQEADNHYTDTLDLDTVIEGSMELVLDDGSHQLEPGDCVVISGVDHTWRAGSDGCLMTFAMLGTPAPASQP